MTKPFVLHAAAALAPLSVLLAGCELFAGVDGTFVGDMADTSFDSTLAIDAGDSDSDSAVLDSEQIDSGSVEVASDSGQDASPCNDSAECTPGAKQTVAGTCTSAGDVNQQTCSSGCQWGTPTCGPPRGWRTISVSPIGFPGRDSPVAVWTGTEALIFGGYVIDATGTTEVTTSTFAKYTLATDTWTQLVSPSSVTTCPSRAASGAAWTGDEMFVWGGLADDSVNDAATVCKLSFGELTDGMLFSPAKNTWRKSANGPLGGRGINAVVAWSAETQRIVVFGGEGNNGHGNTDGALYDPKTDSWTGMPPLPILSTRFYSATNAFWTGSKLVVWGTFGNDNSVTTDGFVFDPLANAWGPMTTAPSSFVFRKDPALVGPAQSLFIYGGNDIGGVPVSSSAIYDVTAGTWDLTAAMAANLEPYRGDVASWFAANRFWIWSGFDSLGSVWVPGGASYDQSTDTWTAMDTTNEPAARSRAVVLWTGESAFVWGGRSDNAAEHNLLNDGAVFTP